MPGLQSITMLITPGGYYPPLPDLTSALAIDQGPVTSNLMCYPRNSPPPIPPQNKKPSFHWTASLVPRVERLSPWSGMFRWISMIPEMGHPAVSTSL